MIKTFQSVDELSSAIATDKKNNSPFAVRYPARLILCNNFNSLKQIVKFLSSTEVAILPLNSLLPHQDGWLTLDDIVDNVKFKMQDTVIIPLSEIIRFFSDSDFNALLTTLFEIENSVSNSFRRIYIPILGLKERLQTVFLNRFHRKDKQSSIWHLDDAVQKRVIINYINFDKTAPLNYENLNFHINHIHSWLDIWKQDNFESIICTSKTMGYLYEKFLPDGLFHIRNIKSYKEYLDYIKGLQVPFEYKTEESYFWKTLTNDIQNHDNFKAYLKEHFNIYDINTISDDHVLKLWLENRNIYSKWLLTNWVLSQKLINDSYLFKLLSNINVFLDEELIDHIWLDIFDDSIIHDSNDITKFTQRKSYLDIIHKQYNRPFHNIEEKLQTSIISISDKPFIVQAKYLTSITFIERKYILELFQSVNKADSHNTTVENCKQIIETLYPELFYYLEWSASFIDTIDNDNLDKKICSYFKEYNLAKVLDCKSVEISSLISELNKNSENFYSWYYKIDSSLNLYSKKSYQLRLKNDSQLIWIDGLGAEWLPLLEYLINFYGKAQNKRVDKKYICRVNLPSITDCNRFDDSIHILDLDEYIHKKSTYTYPDDLVKQIELIERIVKKEILASRYENIIVVSDHGFTFLAQKRFGNIKKFDFTDSNHEGRCMWTDAHYQDDSEFIIHSIDSGTRKGKKALIALKHTSLHDTPSREVHGGATPEEILVPCLVISKIKSVDKITTQQLINQSIEQSLNQSIIYKVELLTKEIPIKNPQIIILIEPHPKDIPNLILKSQNIPIPINISDNNQLSISELESETDGKYKWIADLRGFKPDIYLFELTVFKQKFDLEVSIKGGIKETELF